MALFLKNIDSTCKCNDTTVTDIILSKKKEIDTCEKGKKVTSIRLKKAKIKGAKLK